MIKSNPVYKGLRSIDNNISAILKPIFKNKKSDFLILDTLNKNWQKIVGEKCWKFCFAKQLKFEKNKKSDAMLVISSANASIAFYLETNLNQIIQNIAAIYGYKIVSKIKIVQEPRIIEIDQKKIVKIDKKTEDFIKESTMNIADEELKLTLENLGKSILGNKS